MNLNDLKQQLESRQVDPTYYSLTGGDPPDGRLCIERAADGWHVYFSERDERWKERIFASESEACDYFLAVTLKDPTNRPRTKPTS